MAETFEHAAAVLANYFRFGPGQTVRNPHVQSRMLLWCLSGRGTVRIDGAASTLQPGLFLVLPWNHDITYEADEKHPFHVAGIHLIPWLVSGTVDFRVAHRRESRHPEDSARHDLPIADIAGPACFPLPENHKLLHLCTYCVEHFQSANGPQPETARMLARLLLAEIVELAQWLKQHKPVSANLQHMLNYIEEHLNQELDVDALARAGNCSRATVTRLFHNCLRSAPAGWIRERRMAQAARLLTSTNLPVAKIGEMVGIEDPYHFSKLFKSIQGISAREYRGTASLSLVMGS